MARHKNLSWDLPDKVATFEQANTAVLMDIRDELQALVRLLNCSNALAIPTLLRMIQANTKPRRKKRVRK